VSTLTKEIFLQEYPEIDPGRIRVIHPGVDVEQFSKPARRKCRNEIRRQYGLKEGDMVAVSVSVNYDIRGLDYLMRGLARFRVTHPKEPLKLLVVGKSSKAECVNLARELGIQNDAIYTYVVPHERVADVYRASDLFAMPSRFDTFGLTVLEAMAASLSVIVSENVGAKDLVKQGRNGFIVESGLQEEQIGHALEALSNRNIRNIMSREAGKTVAEYGWDVSLEKYLELYGRILEAKRAAQALWTRRDEMPHLASMGHPTSYPMRSDQPDQRIR
jgi:glycosyltransferase involved in cell wall biosynthesis